MMPPKDIPKDRKMWRKLTLEDKIKLLTYYREKKCSVRKLALHFNIGKTRAGMIIKQENVLFQQWMSGTSVNERNNRLSTAGLEIDRRTYDWYLTRKQDNIEVTGPSLQDKALEFAKDLGYDSFKASNGWLAKFVKRHGILFKEYRNQGNSKSKGKERTNDPNFDFDEWSKCLASVLEEYSDDNIFSVIHTGLFYKAVPDDTTYLLEKTCIGGTLSTERLTVLFCTNMKGKKEKPLVIADIPDKEIENLKLTEVDCMSNKYAFLNKNIMNKWLKNLDNRLVEQEKKIALFLDESVPRHDCQLSNVKCIYFSNVSSSNQRFNQTIIQNFKVMYRLQVLKHLIAFKEKDLTEPFTDHVISLFKALTWISLAWKELSQNIIHQCFEEFCFNVTSDGIYEDQESVTLNDISDLLCAYDSLTNASDYVNIDDCLVTVGEDPKPVEIVVDVDHIYAESDEEEVNGSKNDISADANNDISNFYYESLTNLKQLELFYLSQNDSKGASLVKQLITHHENVIGGKNTNNQS